MIEDLDGEIWLPLMNYEGLYEISNMGRVKSVRKNAIIDVTSLRNDSMRNNYSIEDLVISHFMTRDTNDDILVHIDGNRFNHRVSNLKFISSVNEEWRDIKGFEGKYQISDNGNVRSFAKVGCVGGKRDYSVLLSPNIDSRGYYTVYLFNGNVGKRYWIHRLVALYFIPNPQNLPVVNHIDENKLNNQKENLEWCTQKYNIEYSQNHIKGAIASRKPVVMYDKDGNKIREFESVVAASKYLGLNETTVSSACGKPNRTVKGFIFKYK